MTQDYFAGVLKAYWFAPPVALWRAVELRAASGPCQRAERPMLDLGCGDGLIGDLLFGDGGVEVGLDPWADQLRQAAASGVYGHVDRAAGDALPYHEASFATVFSNSVLEHIPDVEEVLREVGRVLKPGGHFIFTVPSHAFRRMLDGYQERSAAGDEPGAEAYAAEIDERLQHYHYHTPGEWQDLLSQAGMQLLQATYYMPEEVERFWDRMNRRYRIGQRWSPWSLVASPRLRGLGYQRLVRGLLVNRLRERWQTLYEMDVEPGNEGGGLLVVAQRSPVLEETA